MTHMNETSDDDATIVVRPAAPPARILCSVGRNGINRPEDVMVLRALLAAALPGRLPPAASERRCDPDLIATIEEFQLRVVGMTPASGRVEPDGHIMRALVGA